ncbi:class I SAM-dependent methyltransferase [Entomomonas asaccharolytica]|uniref:Class I SAM-dependent methyltransferase n=1 Tax=Entomomonas asaccharolytica TaxID=2785331 RepID=A0A974RWR4_9GAMM|nr:class I SAM-dependent methyltransferase [Entomomonas asaccharolytica]QQP85476.1 class I SAM-dependent methyltransferase [Entomomonas asaccharolytica]
MMLDAQYFDQLYQSSDKPWQNEDDWYEKRKRHLINACLIKQHYNQILELGCGTGFNTELLSKRCNFLLGFDFSSIALEIAKEKLAEQSHVEFRCLDLPAQWPADTKAKFDLIVVSEFAYYLTDDDLKLIISCCVNSLAVDGELIFCNWLPDCHDRLQDTQHIHQLVSQTHNLRHQLTHKDKLFLIDSWCKCD